MKTIIGLILTFPFTWTLFGLLFAVFYLKKEGAKEVSEMHVKAGLWSSFMFSTFIYGVIIIFL